jgi:NAD(P) transhydrogenase subunit alpha
MPSTCARKWPNRSNPWARSSSSSSFRGRVAQDGAATGGYAPPSEPRVPAKQLEKFREIAPDMDIVITTALIPNRAAPVLWTKDMVEAMKPGSVIVDLAAERGGNCELTVKDEKIVTDNGVTIIGYTDFPSRMAAQSSTLYATNIRHMMTDLTPEKDGQVVHNMEDDVIRGATSPMRARSPSRRRRPRCRLSRRRRRKSPRN